jgi:phage gpG-like protein
MARRVKALNLRSTRRAFKSLAGEYRTAARKISSTTLEFPTGVGKLKFREIDLKDIKTLRAKLVKEVDKAHRFAVRQLTEKLSMALDDAMDSPVWDWINDTRDIVDKGVLKSSKKVYIDSDNDIHIIYNKEYAAIVHYGGYVNAFGDPQRSYYYPARPWVLALFEGTGPIPQFQFEEIYEAAFFQYLNQIKI